MGTCKYCGLNAGFFSNKHKECFDNFNHGMSKIIDLAAKAARTGDGAQTIQQQISSIAFTYLPIVLPQREALVAGWEQAVNEIMNDNIITEIEESYLMNYAQLFNLEQNELNLKGAFTKAAYGCALRDILSTGSTSRAVVNTPLPFNLQNNENLVWYFRNVQYYEEKIHKTYVSQSQGLSFRVMKGVYYRVGNSRGYPVETSKNEQIDVGMLGVTTKQIYFSGQRKSFRTPYSKIVSFTPYSDGIGICKDGANSKPQTFITGEGWFVYNLVMNLSQQSV